MKRLMLVLVSVGVLVALVVPLASASSVAAPQAKHPTYALGKAKECKTGYSKETLKIEQGCLESPRLRDRGPSGVQ